MKAPYRPARQRGAVLAVSLVMLLVLSLIGLGALQGSTMDERMAANLLGRHLAFQAAESAARAAADPAVLTAAVAAAPDPVTGSVDLGRDGLSATYTVEYLGDNTAAGYSLGVDGTPFRIHLLRARAGGTLDGTGAAVVIERGFNVIGPAQ